METIITFNHKKIAKVQIILLEIKIIHNNSNFYTNNNNNSNNSNTNNKVFIPNVMNLLLKKII
jgi:hypothetical protein